MLECWDGSGLPMPINPGGGFGARTGLLWTRILGQFGKIR